MTRDFPHHNGLVWFVTGSSRGFGRALCEAALAAGHRLVATARDPRVLAPLVERFGDRVRTVALDVTDANAATAAVRTAIDAFGRIDVVVNNAGYGNVGSIEDLPDDDFRAQFETNFFGLVNVTRAALPYLREQRSGHFMQFSSIGGRIGSAGLSAYQSAKFAVEGFSEVLWKEVAPFGVKVTIVEPGAFRTDWAGTSMQVLAMHDEYQRAIGPITEHRRSQSGQQPGDPARAAQVLLDVAAMASPPLRLLLGSDAVRLAAGHAMWRTEEDAKWRHLSLSTDFVPPTESELAAIELLVDLARHEAANASA